MTKPATDGAFELRHFSYKAPAVQGQRALVPLARSDVMIAMVQVFAAGNGERELHSHAGMDGLWFVLKGRVNFYGDNDVLFASAGEHEGVFVPRGTPYWFENADDQPLEILQMEAIDKTVKNTLNRLRKIVEPERIEIFTPEGDLVNDSIVQREIVDGE